jgi:phage antirepressor YoqD-like protein
MSGEIVRVDFHGDELLAMQNEGGIWSSLRRMCECLDVDYSSQLAKLKTRAWAVMGQCPTTGPDGKTYSTTMLHVRAVPMWLAGINPDKVAPHAREKLIEYQLRCADVLANHFAPKVAPITPALPDLRNTETAIALLAQSLEVLQEERTKRLAAENALAKATPAVEFVERYVEARGNVGLRVASKILRQKQTDFVAWLIERGYCYRTASVRSISTGKERTGIVLPRAGYEQYFEVRTALQELDDGDRTRLQTMITPLGITWLAKKLGVVPDMEAA